MSRERLINAFNLLAEAAAMVAIELEANDAPAAGSPSPAPVSAAGAPVRAPAAATPGEYTHCPKHGAPFENGNYGPYCKQMTDDPAWGKAKTDRDGNPVLWCRITPKNAAEWVKVNGAA